MSILSKYKEEFTTLFVIIACLTIYKLILIKGTFQLIFSMLVFLVLIPVLFNKYILKRKTSEIGLTLGNWKKGIIYSSISLIIVSLVLFLILRYTPLLNDYRVTGLIGASFGVFLFYQLVFIPFFVAIYEVFFRGFILFRFEAVFKYWVILFQLVLYAGFLMINESSDWMYVFFILFAPFSGFIALKSRSVLYPIIFQVLAFLIIDVSLLVLK